MLEHSLPRCPMPQDRTTLAQLQEHGIRRLLVACKRCSRLDSYGVRQLAAEHGAAAGCSAVYRELPVLFGADR